MKKIKSILAICTVTLLLASCAKDGETGPQGPAGQNGADGNANVSSQTIKVSSSDWVLYNNTLGGLDWVAQKYVPQITSDIISNGMVMVYMRQTYSGGGYYYVALPFSWVINTNSMRTYGFSISEGTLNIHVEDTDNSLGGLGTYYFKVVTVDGNRLASNPNVNLSNYKEVKVAFNLSD